MPDIANWKELKEQLKAQYVTLVAVSKKKPVEDLQALYDAGERNFGENYVQELVEKQPQLPADIQWHYIGHLQTNKVKYIAPFVHMIHAVDSFKLLKEINKRAEQNNRVIDVLLQLHVADEETKHGLDNAGVMELMEYYKAQEADLQNVRICGVMGMATFTDDEVQIKKEFADIRNTFTMLKDTYFMGKDYFTECSMGMTSDYKLAIEQGSTLVRIGSMIFGARN